MSLELIQQFADLFEGRNDAYGTDSGGCQRVQLVNDEQWLVRVSAHLDGEFPIGVYPLVERWVNPPHKMQRGDEPKDWYCKWACWDGDIKTADKPAGDYKDEDDAHIAARNLQSVLRRLGVTSFIERTKNHGRHCWVFADSWVPAATMRKALLVACGVAGVSTREIFPKQVQLAEGQVGNYARLPYPGALTQSYSWDLPQTIIYGATQRTIAMDAFIMDALASRASLETLQSIADKYKEPTRPTSMWTALVSPGSAEKKLGPLSRHYLASGNTADRSKLLEAFVRSAKDDGLSPSETLVLADELAAKTGKFEGRVDRERQLRVIVERAWR